MPFRTHLKALLKKNWILWKRSCFCSIIEIIIPCLFILALLGIRRLVDTEDVPQKSFVSKDLYDFSVGSFVTKDIVSSRLLHQEQPNHNEGRILDIVSSLVR